MVRRHPTLLAILVVFLASPRSAVGVACRVVPIGLLVSLWFLGESVLRVVMSAPLFDAIAVLVGSAVDFSRRRPDRRAQSTLSCLGVLVLIPMSLEGVSDARPSTGMIGWSPPSSFTHRRRPWATRYAAVMAHLYSAGLAGWDEDLRQGSDARGLRIGAASAGAAIPPVVFARHQSARLYVSEQCSMCSEVGLWFRHRGVRNLAIAPAETHPSGELTRITYEDDEGTFAVTGVNAIARALGHLHFGWSVRGLLIGLPVISALVQLVADASDAGPRQIPRKAADQAAA